jgi:hypothetical protein
MKGRFESRNLLAVLIRSQQEEIEKYKWIESEKRGHDIGWAHAVTEWQDRHYADWRSHVMRGGLDNVPNANATLASENPRPEHVVTPEYRRNITRALCAWHQKRASDDAEQT